MSGTIRRGQVVVGRRDRIESAGEVARTGTEGIDLERVTVPKRVSFAMKGGVTVTGIR